MPQVNRAHQANGDLIDMLRHIGRHNPTAASRFSADVDKKCGRLAQFPELGAACEELAPGLRQVSVGKYVLFYRPTDDGIELIRVLHGARDIATLFNP
jgi:toxin ParE1/3/4